MNNSKLKQTNKLKRNFYTRDVLKVAKSLLGKILVVNFNGKKLSGIIVETEAYDQINDEASHSFRGKTKRNNVMFELGGHLYVYFTYGVHYCCNVVAGKQNRGCAVLIRALEPVDGISNMQINRFGKVTNSLKDIFRIANGPGKVCKSMAINYKHNGLDLIGNEIFILNSKRIRKSDIMTSKRIGISKSKELPWRFYLKDNPFVSNPGRR